MIANIMSKHTFFIRIAICLLGLLVLLAGCQDKTGEAEKPSTVVSQKISTKSQKVTPQTPKAKEVIPVATPSKAPLVKTPGGPAETKEMTKPLAETFDAQTLISDLTLGYDPKGRIDPFIPLVKDEPVKVETTQASASVDVKGVVIPERAKTPLEKIELSQVETEGDYQGHKW